MHIRKAAAACLAAGLVIALSAAESQPSAGEKVRTVEEQGAILDTIAQINHINWVWNTIKTYNNVVVLEEEYDKISSGNLNLNRIPDEETLGRITQMLDTLYSLRKDDRALKRWRQDFRESRERKQRDFKTKAAKEAKDKLVAQAKECCSLWDWVTNPGGSLLSVANTVYDMGHYAVSLHNDYDNFVYGLDKEASDKEFSFDTAKMDLLHQQNKALLEDQWKLIRRYNLDDRLRVSDNDIRALLSCLKGENHEYIFRRLLPMRERFSRFPEFWYYFSCAAMETGHFKEGLEACDTFFKVNRGIFRDDPMEGTIALNKAFMLPKTDANKPELRRCLELAWKANDLRGDWQISYLSAIMYKGVFDEKDKAEEMLENAIALIDAAIRDRKHYGSKAGVTLEEGLLNCRNALHQLRGEPLEEVKPREQEPQREYNGLKEGDSKTFKLPGGVSMEMVYVAPGSFQMGNKNGKDDQMPVHKVTLTKGYWIGKYPVTQAQWNALVSGTGVSFEGGNPVASFSRNGKNSDIVNGMDTSDFPMESVSWDDCKALVDTLNRVEREGRHWSLPTEAQWEFAARGGNKSCGYTYSGGNDMDSVGWYYENSGVRRLSDSNWEFDELGNNKCRPHSVKEKCIGNELGIVGMSGNVWEWCNDWYDKDYYASSPIDDPQGPATGGFRVSRGGGWPHDARCCCFAFRICFWPRGRLFFYGFRLCCSAEPRE